MHDPVKNFYLGRLTYKTPNPFCQVSEIFIFSDVPDLLKTIRNCWSNSFANKYSRALWVSTGKGYIICMYVYVCMYIIMYLCMLRVPYTANAFK